MNILPLGITNNYTNNKSKQLYITNNGKLNTLNKDCVSFTAMKKNEFQGYDANIVEKFKPPIQNFNNNNDLQQWAEDKCKDIIGKDYGGRRQETQIQRRAMLKEWGDYVLYESGFYTPAQQLVILDGITKNLKPNETRLPPVLNKGVLADTVDDIEKTLKEDSKAQINFIKKYETNLKALYLEDTNTGETGTKWVIIPSKRHDPENFDKNVEKLKMLSHKNWCTKSGAAVPYLRNGDFHIYLVDGQPKLGVRYTGNKIAEIQGEKNNSYIPVAYYEEAIKHIDECCSKKNKILQKLGIERSDLSDNAKREISNGKFHYELYNKAKVALSDAIENDDYATIFNYFDMNPKRDKDGLFTISHFEKPMYYNYSDLGINENKMMKQVKKIEGNAYISSTNITKLINCEEIGGDLDCGKNFLDIGKLKKVGGDVNISESKVSDLKELQYIGGNLNLKNNLNISSLKNIEEVGGDITIGYDTSTDYERNGYKCPMSDLGKLKKVGGTLTIGKCRIKDLGNLEEVGGDLNIAQAESIKTLSNLKKIKHSFIASDYIESLGELEYIGGNADFGRCERLKDTGKLKEIGHWADFTGSSIERLPELRRIGTAADFGYSRIEDLNKLEEIGGSVKFSRSMVRKLGALKKIGGEADFSYSYIKDLENIEYIGGEANFENSPVENLGKLEEIGGNANFTHSKLKRLFNLKTIGGTADFQYSKIESLGNIERIEGSAIFKNSCVKDLGAIKYISHSVFRNDNELDTDKLKQISYFINGEFNDSQFREKEHTV